jgi:uncharacterized protein YdhG (YjbR/CyaY superfamily)
VAGKPETIDQYLAGVAPEKRAALEALRKTIHAAAPGAEELISYGLPHFRLDGAVLMAIGAAAKHCAIYPCSSTAVATLKDELAGFDTSPGTVRFKVDAPPSDALVRRIVEVRKAENAAIAAARTTKRKR